MLNSRSLNSQAKEFLAAHSENIEYILKFGSPIEKALVNKAVELAGGKE